MSAAPQTTIPAPIIAAAEQTVEGVLAGSVKRAADGLAARLGVTDPGTVAKYEAGLANLAAAAIETVVPLAGKLLASKGL